MPIPSKRMPYDPATPIPLLKAKWERHQGVDVFIAASTTPIAWMCSICRKTHDTGQLAGWCCAEPLPLSNDLPAR